MPIGARSGFLISNPFIYTGYTETLTQFSDAFNAQSGGCLTLSAESKRADYEESSFFQNVSNLIGERDPNSTSAAADKVLPQSKLVEIKLNRKVGPVAQTYDSFRKIGMGGNNLPGTHDSGSGIDVLDMVIGQQTAKAVQVERVNTLLSCLTTALSTVPGVTHTATGATADTTGLVNGLAKMGDAAANNIRLWVMHSKVFYDLVKQQLTANIDGVTDFVTATATPITLNRPVLVIDSPSLVTVNGVSAGVDRYRTLGLGPNAASAIDTEDMMLASQLITGLENLAVRLQGEYSYNVGIRGFAYNVAGGGISPSAAALATGSNWLKQFADNKDLGGVLIETR